MKVAEYDSPQGPIIIDSSPSYQLQKNQAKFFHESVLHTYLAHRLFNLANNYGTRRKLLPEMIQGTEESTIVRAMTPRGELLGGCMITTGKSPNTLRQVAADGNSSLSTLRALELDLDKSDGFSSTPELLCACFSRFFIETRITNPNTRRVIAIAVLSHMGLQLPEHIQNSLLDTHDSKVVESLTKYYGGFVLAHAGNCRVRPEAADTLIGQHHYSPLIKEIAVIGFVVSHQKEEAEKSLKNLSHAK